MIVTIKLLKAWKGLKAGTVTEASQQVADQLIADKWATLVTPKRGAKPTRTKVAKPASVKG